METKITNGCYEYVHLSIETYNTMLKSYADEKEKKEQLEDKVTELMCQIELFKQNILNTELLEYRIKNYTLEDCTNKDGWEYALDNQNDLLKIGFTIQEMNEFITKKWEEFHSLKEEEENE